MILGRRDNFAWLTGGGDNSVVRCSEQGFSLLVVTPGSVYHVAQVMDGPRILDEELGGMDVEPVFLRWYEHSREQRAAVSMSVPGRAFGDILEVQKEIYRETGFAEEWRNHYQGGITGYILADPTLCVDPDAVVSPGQVFDWFVTITGAKVEELSISGARPEVLSARGAWPTKTYTWGDTALQLPQILGR